MTNRDYHYNGGASLQRISRVLSVLCDIILTKKLNFYTFASKITMKLRIVKQLKTLNPYLFR